MTDKSTEYQFELKISQISAVLRFPRRRTPDTRGRRWRKCRNYNFHFWQLTGMPIVAFGARAIFAFACFISLPSFISHARLCILCRVGMLGDAFGPIGISACFVSLLIAPWPIISYNLHNFTSIYTQYSRIMEKWDWNSIVFYFRWSGNM